MQHPTKKKMITDVEVRLLSLQPQPNMSFRQEDLFRIQVYFSSSRAESRTFRITDQKVDFLRHGANHTVKVSNIVGKNLEFWLVQTTANNKIIVNSSITLFFIIQGYGNVDLLTQQGHSVVELKLESQCFAKLEVESTYSETVIERQIILDPDEDLLKKTVDPLQEKRRKEEQLKKTQQQEREKAILAKQQEKKPAITITTYNKKEEPYI